VQSLKYLIPIVFIFMWAKVATATPVITETVSRYSISGLNPDELRAAMDNSGPTVGNGRYNASTEYFVKWDSDYEQNAAGCKITSARVSVNANYTFPEWQDYANSSIVRQNDWDKFISMLKQHERGHAAHGVQAAREVEAMLARLPMMTDCTQLEKTAKEKTDIIISKYKVIDADYDRITNHGANQTYS
jgi:predicted secreted Zn-dependent protease